MVTLKRQFIAAFLMTRPTVFEKRYSLPDIQLAAVAYNDPEKPVLLAIHGWLDNAASFAPIAKLLPEYHIIAIELAGHGHSQHRPAGAHYHLLDYVQDLHALVSHLQLSPVAIVGHSLGGIIASIYAATFPELVSHLVLLESAGPLTLPASSSREQLKEAIHSRLAMFGKTIRQPDSFEAVVKARALAGQLDEENASLLVRRNLSKSDNPGESWQWRSDPCLRTKSLLRLTEPQAEAFMQGVACPVLAVCGEQGFEKVRANWQARQHWLKQLHRVTCPGGHHLHMQYPLEVAQVVREFLA